MPQSGRKIFCGKFLMLYILKKVLTLSLYFAILSYIVFQKTMKTEYYIVSGFAKNNGRGAKAISTAKQNKGQASRFCEKGTFAEAFERMPFFVCWGRGKYPLDCHFGGELSLVLSRLCYAGLRSIYVRMYHESSSESIHGFFIFMKKPQKNEFLGKKETNNDKKDYRTRTRNGNVPRIRRMRRSRRKRKRTPCSNGMCLCSL